MIHLSGDIWKRWEQKRKDLERSRPWKLAGLFHGHEGPGFREAPLRILYTGKATAGAFNPTTLDNNYFGCNRGAFWSLARRLSSLTGGDAERLDNIAWSNLCKIGTVHGNPGNELVAAQADLAVETLRQEWTELRPSLVVCVAEGYQEHLIYAAMSVVQDQEDGFEVVRTGAGDFWTRPALGENPAFLWMKHPQGKARSYVEAAQTLAQRMLAG